MAFYKGFSSYEFERVNTFKVLDQELVKLDILNQIFTRKGERVMMPNFGSIVPDIVFEPLDDTTLDILEEDLVTVVNFDPRVDLLEFSLEPDYDNNAVAVHMKLLYIELDLVDDVDLNILFEGV